MVWYELFTSSYVLLNCLSKPAGVLCDYNPSGWKAEGGESYNFRVRPCFKTKIEKPKLKQKDSLDY